MKTFYKVRPQGGRSKVRLTKTLGSVVHYRCSKCGEYKELEYFGYVGKTKVQSWCKECKSALGKTPEAEAKRKEHYQREKEAIKRTNLAYSKSDKGIYTRRIRNLRKFYGLSEEMYSERLDYQRGCCAVCGESLSENPHVDHNHKTGEVRGILCSHCNHMIGNAKDNPVVLRAGADYLEGDYEI